ncbi:MAG: Phage shock protein [Planctomycetota bacterium]|jgi:phage shock protein A
MPHFSRLTDIITCSITDLLRDAQDPRQVLQEVLGEMQEGLSACHRNVRTSTANHQRLEREICDCQTQIDDWRSRARDALQHNNETAARQALHRKAELESLIDGLRPELDAAAATCQNLVRIRKALEARFSEAIRRMEELTGTPLHLPASSATEAALAPNAEPKHYADLEAELEALRRELQQ